MLKITLNLLPPHKKEALRQGFVLAYVQTMLFLFFLVAVLIAGILIPVRMMLNADHAAMAQQTSPESDELANSIIEIREINVFLERIEGMNERLIPWSGPLRGITDLAPAGIRLESMQVTAQNLIKLSGTAATRADLLTFEERLKKAAFLTNVQSPLSNILQKRDVKFEIDATFVKLDPQK